MGLFDAIEKGFNSVVSGAGDYFGSADFGSDLLGAAVNFGGQYLASNANDDAADKIAESNAAQVAAIQAGNAAAQGRYDDLLELSRPGTESLREILGRDPYILTPGQEISLDDVRRDAGAALSATGLRGAGRATTEAIKQTSSGFRAASIDTNLSRQDSAAAKLSGLDASVTGASAGLDTNTGATQAAGIASTTDANVGADLANADLRGQAIGDITSFLSNAAKEKGRESRFADARPSQ